MSYYSTIRTLCLCSNTEIFDYLCFDFKAGSSRKLSFNSSDNFLQLRLVLRDTQIFCVNSSRSLGETLVTSAGELPSTSKFLAPSATGIFRRLALALSHVDIGHCELISLLDVFSSDQMKLVRAFVEGDTSRGCARMSQLRKKSATVIDTKTNSPYIARHLVKATSDLSLGTNRCPRFLNIFWSFGGFRLVASLVARMQMSSAKFDYLVIPSSFVENTNDVVSDLRAERRVPVILQQRFDSW